MADECFVCLQAGGAPLVRACACNMFAHAACLQRVVRSVPSHATACAVCRQPYALAATRRRTCVVDPDAWRAAAVYSSVVLSVGVNGWLYVAYGAHALGLALVSGTALVAVAVVHATFFRRTGSPCCVRIDRVRDVELSSPSAAPSA